MIRNKEEKLIIVISFGIAIFCFCFFLILGIFVDKIPWTWCFSILIGYVTSLFCFLKSNFIITKVLETNRDHAKFLLILNNVISSFCYVGILLINYFVTGFNIFVTLGGILIIKIVVIIIGMINKK